MKELLPCPFCGGEASYGTARLTGKIAELNERTEGHFVNCITCGANNNILNLGYATKEKAKEQWNARTEQGWIDVSDRLPEDSSYYLVYSKIDDVVRIAQYGRLFMNWQERTGEQVCLVTKWQPLPKP